MRGSRRCYFFYKNVAWESIRKYIALHIIYSIDECAGIINLSGRKTLRLTVHEKTRLKG